MKMESQPSFIKVHLFIDDNSKRSNLNNNANIIKTFS